MALGDGQYRLRIQRFRFRYDIKDRLVTLAACKFAARGQLLEPTILQPLAQNS